MKKYGIMYFELTGGGHTEGNKFDDTDVEYKKGDIIESTVDLEKKFGSKFKRIGNKGFISATQEIIIPRNIEVDCIGEYRLSILICSVIGRERKLNRLLEELKQQYHKAIEILVEIDNREITTGAKRNILLEKAKGDYIAFIDDDDRISINYVVKILRALKTNPDCCSLNGFLIRPKHVFPFYHSIDYLKWYNKDGIYYRSPNHLNAVKRELALQAKFPDKTMGEDVDYSTRLKSLLKTETKIQGTLYYYLKNKK